jgi:hypothetical protein
MLHGLVLLVLLQYMAVILLDVGWHLVRNPATQFILHTSNRALCHQSHQYTRRRGVDLLVQVKWWWGCSATYKLLW